MRIVQPLLAKHAEHGLKTCTVIVTVTIVQHTLHKDTGRAGTFGHQTLNACYVLTLPVYSTEQQVQLLANHHDLQCKAARVMYSA